MINDIIAGLPQDGSSSQFIGIAVDLLQQYDNAFIKGSNISSLVSNPDPEIAAILSKITQITKTGNNVNAKLTGDISYGLPLGSATIYQNNNITINTLTNDLVELGITGVGTSFGKLSKVEITSSYVKVKVGFIWKTVAEF